MSVVGIKLHFILYVRIEKICISVNLYTFSRLISWLVSYDGWIKAYGTQPTFWVKNFRRFTFPDFIINAHHVVTDWRTFEFKKLIEWIPSRVDLSNLASFPITGLLFLYRLSTSPVMNAKFWYSLSAVVRAFQIDEGRAT